MTLARSAGRSVRVRIRSIGIRAGSALEARRLADGIGPALERALERVDAGEGAPRRRRASPAEHAAAQVAAAVVQHMRGKGGEDARNPA